MPKQTIRTMLLLGGLFVLAAFALAACSTATPPPATPCPACLACPEKVCPTAPPVPTAMPTLNAPNYSDWEQSGHNTVDAAAFHHWDSEDPAEIPPECAKCHSQAGFQDYVGADGSAAMVVDQAAPIGSTVTCVTCHNSGTANLSEVDFPSGQKVTGLGSEAVCMTCHSGVAAGATVDQTIKDSGVTDDDTPSDKLAFTNIHYLAAAVSQYGTLAKGGYEYSGQGYDGKFGHVEGMNTCTDCHDSHSLEVRYEQCAACHSGVASADDVKKIRMAGSEKDYNGNGDVKEGIYAEVDGLRQMLLKAIQAYASEVVKKPIVYSPDTYPYFFNDTNANGQPDKDELAFPNAYKSFTARLAKAAYNYQLSVKDPGGYVHGGKYVMELLYDSIADLNTRLTAKVDLGKASRVDASHFNGSAEAFRHWDAEGVVPGSCARCHSAGGLPQLITEGVVTSQPIANGLACATCHNDLQKYTRYEVKTVTFPSGAVLGFANDTDSNLCLECHQGRESSVSVSKAVAGLPPDTVSDQVRFRNVHYLAAGATLFGTEAKGAYEYPGKTYAGKFAHTEGLDSCKGCHDVHSQEVKVDTCKGCHGTDDPGQIRMNSKGDYDGNGDVTGGIQSEVDGLKASLLAAIQLYARDVAKQPIVYSPTAYPYWFIDTNADGKLDPAEADAKNAYASWTPRLSEAAYNYQYATKDPGSFAHNATYIMQVLVDSIQDLGSRVNVAFKGKRP
jgi:hypothetical protein